MQADPALGLLISQANFLMNM